MSLVPKVDEVRDFLIRHEIDIAFITETWLKESIHDNIIAIPGFTALRRDRIRNDHGGVCAYIKHNNNYTKISELNCCDDHEVLWFRLRPHRLPRGVSCIIAAVVYHPPSADTKTMIDHLFQALTLAESKYPNCGLIIAGDFNRLNISKLLNHFRMKQLVKVRTRKNATLDLILTNLSESYNVPQAYPPFGYSDHNTVVAFPKYKGKNPSKKKFVVRRDPRPNYKYDLGNYLSRIDWISALSNLSSSEDMWNVFHKAVHLGLDLFIPSKRMQVCTADAPWMNQKLKSLILKRQKAFSSDGVNSCKFKYFRNQVNRERKIIRAKYYDSKIKHLKGERPKKWWGEVKLLSGMKLKNDELTNQIKVKEICNLSHHEQANSINLAFLEPLEEYRLPNLLEYTTLEESPVFAEVTEMKVQQSLAKLNRHKATGPDAIPNWLLKEYSFLLAQPITLIFNKSYREQHLPTGWKMADVTPIPKTKPVQNLKKDLRPISLTPCISKIAEGFIVDDYLRPAILQVIDENQYGAIPNSSTALALISMLHHWHMNTDGNGATIRTILFDYQKAFDFIDHSIIIEKLSRLDLPRSVLNWTIDFLSNRFQRVKLSDQCYSEWKSVPSGVPQGTKLGPWLFVLMINDLVIRSDTIWKYVDDITASEIVHKGNVSNSQAIADEIMSWSSKNKMQLNSVKCKELRISFSNIPTDFDPIIVNGKEIDVVDSVDLLGLTITNQLTWNAQITKVIKKANKRLYFLVQLKRAKVPPEDLVLFYITCIRSVINYGIPVFYHSLPEYLKTELLRLEKRALSIILPEEDYQSAVQNLKISPIQEHHEYLCDQLFQSVVSNPNHKLAKLLPPRYEVNYNLRNNRKFIVQRFYSNRASNSFIPAMCRLFQET